MNIEPAYSTHIKLKANNYKAFILWNSTIRPGSKVSIHLRDMSFYIGANYLEIRQGSAVRCIGIADRKCEQSKK